MLEPVNRPLVYDRLITVRLPAAALDRADSAARSEGVTRSAYLRRALSQGEQQCHQ
jgi:hypothetical protein